MVERLGVPALRSGGVMLGYRCNQACRHCSYRSAPGVGGWMDEDTLGKTLDMLAGQRRLVDIHIGGGEATLNPELLEQTVRQAIGRKIRLSYLETNGHYAESVDAAEAVFAPLKAVGLISILVSVSPYHNEFIPLRHTLNCIEAGTRVFGEDGVFPWLGHFLPMLAKLDPDRTHRLEEFLDANAMAPNDRRLLQLFPLTPGGNVPKRLRPFFRPLPAESFAVGHCLDILTDVSHFHVDPYGNIFTGHCPGIISARLDDPHREKTMETDPVFVTLALGGPYELMRLAERECGFAADPAGYISPCDLCFQARRALFRHDAAAWPELGPAEFYRE